jgi:hypothetical protein
VYESAVTDYRIILTGWLILIVSGALGFASGKSAKDAKWGLRAGLLSGVSCYLLLHILAGPLRQRWIHESCAESYSSAEEIEACVEEASEPPPDDG